MKTVRVGRDELLGKLRENRSAHRDLFLEAQKGYRVAVISELDQMLAEARAGSPIRRGIALPEPQDHTDDYDTVISMLEMSVDSDVELSHSEFSQYVRDDWSWKAMAMHVNSSYTATGIDI